MDFQRYFPKEFHLSVVFSKGLSLSPRISTGIVQWIFNGIFRWNFSFVISGVLYVAPRVPPLCTHCSQFPKHAIRRCAYFIIIAVCLLSFVVLLLQYFSCCLVALLYYLGYVLFIVCNMFNTCLLNCYHYLFIGICLHRVYHVLRLRKLAAPTSHGGRGWQGTEPTRLRENNNSLALRGERTNSRLNYQVLQPLDYNSARKPVYQT